MSKYILELIDKDPVNNQIIPCSSGQEVLFYKNKVIKMGFQVKVSKAKKEKEKPITVIMCESSPIKFKGEINEYIHKD